jgi:lysophospholipase L1-like esterase
MHRNRWPIVCSVLIVALTSAAVAPLAEAEDFFFHDGDVVVMIGDSITEQHLYSNYVEMWTVTRFPAWKLTFRNVGIGGDRSSGGNARFQRDVVVHHPTVMTIDFGMNDGQYGPFRDEVFQPYLNGLQGMADQAKQANVRAAWITPQPLDGPEPGSTALTGYNKTLERFCEGVKTTAEKNGGLYVDQFHPYLMVVDKARGAAAKYERITGGNAVHPGPPGQALMAASILRGLHFPNLVSTVEIDAAAPRLIAARNCQATELTANGAGITFQRLDAALPFFPSEAAGILRWTPIVNDLNEYGLKVAGLKAGRYEVRLGGTKVAEYSADELAGGVNLASAALATGPIAKQVQAVKAAVESKNKYYHDKVFRGLVLYSVSIPKWLDLKLSRDDIEAKRHAAYDHRMKKMIDLDSAVRSSLEMKPHRVEVIPAAP